MPVPAIALRDDVVATHHIAGLTGKAIEGRAIETIQQVRGLLASRMLVGPIPWDCAHRLAAPGVATKLD